LEFDVSRELVVFLTFYDYES